jgi:hypothetical protein
MSQKWFAVVRWSQDDILSLRPEWTVKRASQFLEDIEKHIRDRMIETGWFVIEHFIDDWEVIK